MFQKLKDYASISPIIIGFLIFIGYLKLYFFYKFWDINISDYINLSEVLSIFIEDIIQILFVLLIAFVFILILGLTIDNNTSDVKKRAFSIDFERRKSLQKLLSFCILALFSFLFIKYSELYFLIPMILYLLQFLIVTLRKSIKFEISIILISFSITITSIIGLSYYEYNKILIEKAKICYIQFKNKTININENIKFIGQTNEFIFIKNIKLNSIIVISKSNLEEIQYK